MPPAGSTQGLGGMLSAIVGPRTTFLTTRSLPQASPRDCGSTCSGWGNCGEV
ncbi:hypothetical protein JAAARDRAFT_27785 [Jaapia argillacea MUCL 33604]|uniref:Uncharacterized protein n=1 Tax=Jaapia argillacea MUCL 33604 TaxID=933084 RepID=A0A067QDA1_9AGAM|nr:hypothetical protein JAAARDRAFT_27785 [Jaapia argillacea MUCL 33604]